MVQTDKKLRIEDYYDAERNEIIDFPPRIKYGVTPCQARGRLFFRGNDGKCQ